MFYRVLIILLITLFGISTIDAQAYEFRVYLGANYYQGDLAPSTSRFSFSPGQLSWSAMAGMNINKTFKVNLKFMTGKLIGRDSDSKNLSRKRRNLDFASPLYEIGINTEVSINQLLQGLNKFGINVYYTTGVNIFHFNPKTFKTNEFGIVEIVNLQPLGTEGQGLEGYDKKYNLTQINIPFGLGFRFHLFDNFELGIEVVPRVTFTDYLDDVSGAYVSYGELMAANRPVAAMLTNRTGEYLGTGVVELPSGSMRGNPDDNDWYFFSGVYLSYNFGAGYEPLKFKTMKTEEELLQGESDAEELEN